MRNKFLEKSYPKYGGETSPRPCSELSHGSEYNMANIFRVSHILPTYFTSLQASEIKAKYEKRGKYWPYCAR